MSKIFVSPRDVVKIRTMQRNGWTMIARRVTAATVGADDLSWEFEKLEYVEEILGEVPGYFDGHVEQLEGRLETFIRGLATNADDVIAAYTTGKQY